MFSIQHGTLHEPTSVSVRPGNFPQIFRSLQKTATRAIAHSFEQALATRQDRENLRKISTGLWGQARKASVDTACFQHE